AFLWGCLLLAAASICMGLSAHAFFPLIASHFAAPKMSLAIHLFYALLPVVVLTGVASTCTAVLNSVEHFSIPAIAPVATPLAVLLGAELLGTRCGVWALVYATLAGALIHTLWVARLMDRKAYRFRLRWYGWDASTREVAGQFVPVLLSSLVASGGLLVDQSMAAMLPAGSVSALVYAGRFVGVVITLLAGTISSAVTPYFANLVAQKSWMECKATLRYWTRLLAAISIPMTAMLIGCAHLLIRVAFQHGAFGVRDTAAVTPVLAMSAIQIPFFVCSRISYRLLIALRRTDLIFYCGLLNLILDIALNLILMRLWGVAGIALATSLWTASTFCFLWIASQRVLRAAEGGVV
ncbi:MAG: lipid II flippase MurJ, partial [Terracidiphilus sp.]